MRATSKRASRLVISSKAIEHFKMMVADHIRARPMDHRPPPLENWRAS
jgi:hypothetical protein